MKSLSPNLTFALAFVVAALVMLVIGQRTQNLYFVVAACVFTLATYVMHPPFWVLKLAKAWTGKRDLSK
jgi:ABC-type uncharacterized transport system permease subunit